MINIIPFLMERGGKATIDEVCEINKEYNRNNLFRSIRKLERIGFIATDRKTMLGKAKNIWLTEKETDCSVIRWHCKKEEKR